MTAGEVCGVLAFVLTLILALRWNRVERIDERVEKLEETLDIETEYALIKDDDGDWYVCPAEDEDRAREHLARVRFGDVTTKGPSWLVPLEGEPSCLRFPDYWFDE